MSPSDQTTAEAPATLHRDERGQVTIIVVFGALAFVLLIAFIYNTAAATSRKIEMQGAADSAAVSAGVWMARGMNLIVLNNNTMVEVLSIMVTVRALYQTAEIMRQYTQYLAWAADLGSAFFPPLAIIAILMHADNYWYQAESWVWRYVDRFLSGTSSSFGWTVLKLLDKFNQIIKSYFPVLPWMNTIKYAELNGADRFPPGSPVPFFANGTLLPRKAKLLTFPIFPVSRAPRERLVEQAKKCPLAYGGEGGKLRDLAKKLIAPLCLGDFVCFPFTAFIAKPLVSERIDINLKYLRGSVPWWEQALDHFTFSPMSALEQAMREKGIRLGFAWKLAKPLIRLVSSVPLFVPPSLRWLASPRPMILTATPGNDTTNKFDPTDGDIREAYKHLQLLALARGKQSELSPIGADRYPNPTAEHVQLITYAQANVYNPSGWDMFTQDWRAKLVRARVLQDKCREMPGLSLVCEGNGFTFVNTH
jgi:hypothetical protein